jgi:ATP/maltotriose-dependent transcriptional regulator MalT
MSIGDRIEVGDWDGVTTCVEEGQVIARETGQPIWDAGTLALSAMMVGLRGDAAAAHAMAAEAEHAAMSRGLNNLLACVQLARGFGLVSTGRHAEAYSALRRLFDPADPCYHLVEGYHGVMYLAEAAVHAGRRDDARQVVAGLERIAAAGRSATLRMHLLYARAVLADDDEAEPAYLAGLAADLMRWPLVRARLELAYGSWLRRRRRVAESRQPLRSALTVFEVIGALTWAAQARAELRAAGERVAGDEPPSARHLLSPQELQIARMAAQGMSNKVIGERLFLSPRTIGSHLYRIFPKLEITSRSQLAARLDGR